MPLFNGARIELVGDDDGPCACRLVRSRKTQLHPIVRPREYAAQSILFDLMDGMYPSDPHDEVVPIQGGCWS
jgi:hypothetical protein